jgi:hypothetical protein
VADVAVADVAAAVAAAEIGAAAALKTEAIRPWGLEHSCGNCTDCRGQERQQARHSEQKCTAAGHCDTAVACSPGLPAATGNS